MAARRRDHALVFLLPALGFVAAIVTATLTHLGMADRTRCATIGGDADGSRSSDVISRPVVSPSNVAEFHAEYDRHPDDRVRLFEAIAELLPGARSVLYPGSYVDIAPSVWFPEVVYVDLDRRAERWFSRHEDVRGLIEAKRRGGGRKGTTELRFEFHHLDYQRPLPLADTSFDLLVSLYAGFVSEHCTSYLKVGGHLLVNPSHGDAAMAALDGRYALSAVVKSMSHRYVTTSDELDTYLVPKKPQETTVETLRATGRGVGYTRRAFAYVFRRLR